MNLLRFPAVAMAVALRALRLVGRVGLWLGVAYLVIAAIGNFGFSARRDVAHRAGHPEQSACRSALDGAWSILADETVGNDETTAALRDPIWSERLRCALQTHAIPAQAAVESPARQLTYSLAFLEFDEAGRPLSLAPPPASSEAPATVVHSQLDVLIAHLKRQTSNYVLVFVHGWRHDASFGDGNVADLRMYAAHAARFLADRQAADGRYRDTKVTAVFLGWPGARVDERRLVRFFGQVGLGTLGYWMGTVAAIPTLFDRKPVSETVGPSALSSLREIDRVLDEMTRQNAAREQRLVVFGHSLGGNMLLTALRDPLVKQVYRHDESRVFPAPIGQLVVLINPASEAGNWTAIQKAVWQQIPMRPDDGTADEIRASHRFFPREQKPVLVSVTAARNWPPGGIRGQDCSSAQTNPLLKRVVLQSRRLEERGVEYDAPTHDMFPAFRFDFRPMADSLTRWARRVAFTDSSDPCLQPVPHPVWGMVVKPVFWLASGLRYFPFTNTNEENSRTVGHLEAPRPAVGHLLQSGLSERPFGTTHELQGLHPSRSELTLDYRVIGHHPKAACPVATGWLMRARQRLAGQNGTLWDSSALEPLPVQASPEDSQRLQTQFNPPAAQFVHGFINTGRLPITRANDPFWNMRAYDNALARHDGYMLSSFICAMQQFVLDDVTARPPLPVITPVPAVPASAN